MAIDIRIWSNPLRMRERIRNLATMVMSISAVNAFYILTQISKNWIIFGINVLFFLSAIPVFISWAKYQKEPPQEMEKEGENK